MVKKIISCILVFSTLIFISNCSNSSSTSAGNGAIPTSVTIEVPHGLATTGTTASVEITSSSRWTPLREIVTGLRLTNLTIETLLTAISSSGITPGTQVTLPVSGFTTTSLKIKLSSISTAYKYLLEIWTLSSTTTDYVKALEFSYNDENSGEMIIRPNLFNSNVFNSEHYVKATYSHTSTIKSMTINVTRNETNKPEKAVYAVTKANNLINLYFTGHMRSSYAGASANDVYLLGAIINATSPYYTAAKYGIVDLGQAYDFTWYTILNPDNSGMFNINDEFVADGISSGNATYSAYPDPANIVSTSLPTAVTVDAVSIAFASTSAPGF